MVLQAGEIRPLGLTGKFLVCRRIEGEILISNPDKGLAETRIYQADTPILQDFNMIYVKNNNATESTITLQSTSIPIQVSDGGSVSISGGSIDSIIEPISVTAQATVENGTVTNLSHLTLEDAADLTINAGATVTVLAADNAASKRTVLVQNISATETQLRVGGATVAAGRGAIIKGSIDAIASYENNILGAVKVHNESATAAKITLSWGVK